MRSYRSAEQRLIDYYMKTLEELDADYQEGASLIALAKFDAEWGQISAIYMRLQNVDSKSIHQDLLGHFPTTGIHLLELRQTPEIIVGWLEVGLAAATRMANVEYQAAHLSNLGNMYMKLANYSHAMALYNRALELHRERQNTAAVSMLLSNIGILFRLIGRYDDAINQFKEAYNLAHELGDTKREGNLAGNIGNIYYMTGRYQDAVAYYNYALISADKIGNLRGKALWLGNLGNVCYNLGKFDRATAYQQQAVTIAREMSDKASLAGHLNNLGLAHIGTENYFEAIKCFEEDLQLTHDLKDRDGEIGSLSNLGLAYRKLNQMEFAYEFYLRALAISRGIGEYIWYSHYAQQLRHSFRRKR